MRFLLFETSKFHAKKGETAEREEIEPKSVRRLDNSIGNGMNFTAFMNGILKLTLIS